MIKEKKDLIELFKEDERIFHEGELIIGKIQELAINHDEKLLSLIMQEKPLFETFFTKNGGVYIFKLDDFIDFIDGKYYLEDSYTKFQNLVGLATSNNNFIKKSNQVVLNFPYKDCVLEGGQDKEDVKRDEVFYNNILAYNEIDKLLDKKVISNVLKYDKCGVTIPKNIDDEDNLIIKGNNLIALSSLEDKFYGSIKLIYIDVPYNTGNDSFGYNDRFRSATWLTFLKNRLEIAKRLLAKDGAIVIQCNDTWVHYLKVLCDEIFDRNNFVNSVTVKMSEVSGKKMAHVEKRLPKIKEHLLIYKKDDLKLNSIKIPKAKWDDEYNKVFINLSQTDRDFISDIESLDANLITDEHIKQVDEILSSLVVGTVNELLKQEGITKKDEQLEWKKKNAFRIFRTAASSSVKSLSDEKKKFTSETFFSVLSKRDRLLYIVKSDYNSSSKSPRVQVLFADKYLSESISDVWMDISTTGLESEGQVELKDGKKPEELLSRIIALTTNEGDRVLDFFVGSGTTCAVAHKMNRKYIGIEQMDYIEEKTVRRLVNVIQGEQNGISKKVNWTGGGSFVYLELHQWNANFIKQIQEAKNSESLISIWNSMKEKSFLSYRVKINKFDENIQEFLGLSFEKQKEFLINILDNNHLYVNLTEIDDEIYDLSEEVKALNKAFYFQN